MTLQLNYELMILRFEMNDGDIEKIQSPINDKVSKYNEKSKAGRIGPFNHDTKKKGPCLLPDTPLLYCSF
jgi:hypothetical protein